MSARKFSLAPAATALLAIGLVLAPAVAVAQNPTPSPAKPHQHPEGEKGMAGMSAMMTEPHHALAMAYRDNVVTFGRALQNQVNTGKAVNLELARPAVTEMRRGFEQIRTHHEAHLAAMAGPADSTMLARKQRMDTHVAAAGEHLSALETALAAGVPDPVRVKDHTAAILKECAGMSRMSGMPAKSTMPPPPKPRQSP